MNLVTLLAAASTVMTAICLAVVFTSRQSYKVGFEASRIASEFAHVNERFDAANDLQSKLSSIVQKLPDEMRAEFMPLADALLRWSAYREDHKELERRVHELELVVARVRGGWREEG